MNTETKASHDAMGATERSAARDFGSSKDKLVADLGVLKADAEQMLREAATSSAEGFAALRARFESKLADAKAQLGHAKNVVGEKTQFAAGAAQTYVKENPLRVAGVIAATGAIVGSYLAADRPGFTSMLQRTRQIPLPDKVPMLALAVTGCAIAAWAHFIHDSSRRTEKKLHKEDLSTWEGEGGRPAPVCSHPAH